MSNKKIEYKGKKLTLGEIAKREGFLDDTKLVKYYRKTGDIDEAVKLCKQGRNKGKIEYYGEMLPISVIAERENLDISTLTIYYKITGSIYEAIQIYRESKEFREERAQIIKEEKESKLIEYKNQRLELKEIAKIEGVDARELRAKFKLLGDIYKAIFMIKYQMREQKTARLKGTRLNLYDLSLLIGVKYSVLNNLLNQGMTIKQIKNIYPCENAGENVRLLNGEKLLDYSIENKLNFKFLYRTVCTYGKVPEYALASIKVTGEENIPADWIYDRYMSDFNKLGITGISTTAIVHNLMARQISLEELLEEQILRKNAEKNGIPVEWGKMLYGIIETRQLIGEEYQSEICFNEKEKDFIETCQAKLKPQGSTNPNGNEPKEQDDITH